MSWIEVIHIRHSDSELREEIEDVLKSMQRDLEREGMSAFNVYTNVMLPKDMLIHLCWPDSPLSSGGSGVGKRIAYQFSQHHSPVCHSVWKLKDTAS